MSDDENTKAFLRVAAPLALVMSPIGLCMFAFAYFRDIERGLEPNIFEPSVVFSIVALIIGFVMAFRYCQTELGLFKRKS